MIKKLEPFKDLSIVDDIELLDLDFKRAESEGVSHQDNYPTYIKAGDVGVLIIHGFTASPLEMKPLADFLFDKGFSVYSARIVGHGSDSSYINETGYEDWYDSVKYGYFTLKRNCRKLFIIGESMGGLVTLMTAHLNGCDGAVLLAPCIKIKAPAAWLTPFVSRFVDKLPKVGFDMQYADIFYNDWPMKGVAELYYFTKYAETMVTEFKMPLLGFQFPKDVVVSAESTASFFERVPSEDKTYKEYPANCEQTHILTSDFNPFRDEMFADIAEWMAKRS